MRFYTRIVWLLAAGLFVTVACDDYPVTTTQTDQATNLRIQIVSGDDQKGIIRNTLPDPLKVEVTNLDGVAVSDVAVQWKVVTDNGGSVRATPTRTNSDGIASNTWRLGGQPGAVDEVIAWIGPSSAKSDTVRFSAQVTGTPDTIVIEQGALETDNDFKQPEEVKGDTVFVALDHWARKPFKAVVKDENGNTVRGATLSWTVTSRGGMVGDEPEGGGAETVKVQSATDGGITVWRRAPSHSELVQLAPNGCYSDSNDNGTLEREELNDNCWIGATLSLEEHPNVTAVTLDALIRLD